MKIIYVGSEQSVKSRLDQLNPRIKGTNRPRTVGALQWDPTWPEAHAYFVLKGEAKAWSGPDQPKVAVKEGQAVFWDADEWFAIETAEPGTELLHASDQCMTPEEFFNGQSDRTKQDGGQSA